MDKNEKYFISSNSTYYNMGFIKRRFHGFTIYILCAFISLFKPEFIDLVLFKTLSQQFRKDMREEIFK